MMANGKKAAALLSLVPVASVSANNAFVKAVAKSLTTQDASILSRRLKPLEDPSFLNQHRRFSLRNAASPQPSEQDRSMQSGGVTQQACDSAFMTCLPNDKCIDCFSTLQVEGIDWASVTPGTPCADVTKFLFDGGHCKMLQGDVGATNIFCSTFDSCVVWDNYSPNKDAGGSGGSAAAGGRNGTIDCSTLKECNWDGFHHSFLGDGNCHDIMPGCYNTEICGFDGGDCCEDTCVSDPEFVICGTDGFACRDPTSKLCDPSLTSKCIPDYDNSDDETYTIDCSKGETMYRLIMYDSFGDGWDQTTLTIAAKEDLGKIIFTGGLKSGAQGTEFICLSKDPKCYQIDVKGGTWGNEVSWEVKALGEGTPALADGGSPTQCNFPIGGNSCARTCSGKPNINPNDDPDYKTYKDMFTCIEAKCLIQVGACKADVTCAPCFNPDAPEFCFANDNFNAVIDCGLCTCGDQENKEFCNSKATPGAISPLKPLKPDEPVAPKACTAAETLKGASSVMAFATCSSFDQIGMMVTDFDENNFGALDSFEACAHSFKNEASHGGRTALGCMTILYNAIINPGDSSSGVPTDAIASLANLLYHDAEGFCECTSKANADCPLCPSFHHFKTLLYESLDACKSLDEIDCDAWNEFYTPCKKNVEEKFGSVDFTDHNQCDYVKDTCGGAGPFPAFRKLDCIGELPKSSWDFYSIYARSCLNGGNGIPPKPAPTVTAVPAPTPKVNPLAPPVKMPTTLSPDIFFSPYPTGAKRYVPPEDAGKTPSSPKKEKKKGKKHHFFRNVFFLGIIGGVGYWYYKKRSEAFSFVRYRRGPRNFGGDSEMYTGLAMDGSSSFEPPSLPPPPSAIDDGGRTTFV